MTNRSELYEWDQPHTEERCFRIYLGFAHHEPLEGHAEAASKSAKEVVGGHFAHGRGLKPQDLWFSLQAHAMFHASSNEYAIGLESVYDAYVMVM